MSTSATGHFPLHFHRREGPPGREVGTGPPRARSRAPNFAARAGPGSATHWRTAVAVWLLFVAAAVTAGHLAGTRQLSDVEYATGDSGRAEQILAGAGFNTPAGEEILVRSDVFPVYALKFRAIVSAITSD